MGSGFRRRRYQATLGRPHGYVTRNAPVRPPVVRSQAVDRAVLQRRLYARSKLGRPRGTVVVLPPPHVRAIRVIGQAVNRAVLQRTRLRTHVALVRPRGHATSNPPIRAPIVKLQAVQKRLALAKLRTIAHVSRPGGGIPSGTLAQAGQAAAEVLRQATGSSVKAQAGQAAAEVLRQATGSSVKVQLGQDAVEVIRQWSNPGHDNKSVVPAQLGQVALEVLRANGAATAIAGPIPAWVVT
jgi:hypothetical protein